MPMLKLLSHDMHYQEFGDAKNPKLLFSNSLGTNLSLWQAQVAALQDDYHIICYDTRGHGHSSTPATGFVLQDLAYDVLALLDHLHIESTHFCGISMGGLIGQWLAIHHAESFQSIVISNTAAKIGQEKAWNERAAQVRAEGLYAIAASAHSRWFTPDYVCTHPEVVMRLSQDLATGSAEGYAKCCEALALADVRSQLSEIEVPMLIIAGLEDPVTTVDDAIAMQAAIFGSQMAEISGASHIANVEQADVFNQVLHRFLAQFKATCKL
ncbi:MULTISPECIES: 3-oxoadipate enol-lactonase [Vitreoscilla]|uniref:3-oxoadipate enol-lactonase n=1 Tax=Vitreoscilla stercoraria TaxID=61 RepID=A0ABY4EC34_VITST|nr:MULTISPECIES: 3-oxoadipate enol-lactonase [Vitreoscilla]QJQ52302.1 3-oxoadipate enol-lactonase [Vitreoscilla sp. C1]UOO93308.1 3-oxoadipate enol-lactonase [Vitreoscilla stercoraria]